MATTTKHSGGVIANLRDRLKRRGETHMADIVRRGEYPMTEWDPFRLMREMLRWDPFRMQQLAGGERDMWIPHFEVRETPNELRIVADVPGARRDDLEISLSGNRLIVSGRRESEERNKDENIVTWERQFGQFTRTFTLPDNIDTSHVTSDLRDGVLTIVVPLKAGTGPRKIPIGTAAKS
jgi:HSP20 family protein